MKASKPIIGIIGGIGAGKSTVAGILAELGCAVIDADALAHQVLELPDVNKAIAARWGEDLRDSLGRIKRSALAARIFEEPDELTALNGLIHPLVLAEVEKRIRRYQADGHTKAIVLDMPLLLEVGWDQRCDHVIFVQCEKKMRIQHFQQKLGGKTADLGSREKVQISLDKKEDRADNVVINNSDFATLVRQVSEIFTNIIN